MKDGGHNCWRLYCRRSQSKKQTQQVKIRENQYFNGRIDTTKDADEQRSTLVRSNRLSTGYAPTAHEVHFRYIMQGSSAVKLVHGETCNAQEL